MSLSVIFLVVCIFAVSQGATTIDSKNGHRQSDIQVTRPTVSESSSVRSIQDELRNAHLKLQANQIEGSGIRDDKLSHQAQIQFHSQDLQATGTPLDRDIGRDQALFQSQRNALPTTTISTVPSENGQLSDLSFRQQLNQDLQRNPDNQQLFNSNLQSRNQQQFYNDKQQASDEQHFYNSRQQQSPSQQQLFPSRQQTPSQQQFYNFRQQTPYQPEQIYHPKEQSSSFQDQQQMFNTREQVHEQQKIFSNMQAMDINDQRINLNHQFQGVSVHQSQIQSDRPRILSQDLLTQIQTKGIRKDMQLSAYDNREHGLTLPRSSSVHSASVVVSGLKNLPLLPAMVYNGGAVPSAHAIAYGRDGYYKGSASLRQHLQTPYVRYVYSHIL